MHLLLTSCSLNGNTKKEHFKTKKEQSMKNILPDKEISYNLCLVIDALGMTNSQFSKQIKKSLANVTEYRENKRRAIHLVPFLVELGINGNWYLTGEGEMMLKDVHGAAPESRRYEQAGRFLEMAVNALKA